MDDGHRYEIVDGVLLVNAAPTPRHQRVQQLLWRVLDAHCPADLWVMTAPLDPFHVTIRPADLLD